MRSTAAVPLANVCFKCEASFQGGEETVRREERNFKTISKIEAGLALANEVP